MRPEGERWCSISRQAAKGGTGFPRFPETNPRRAAFGVPGALVPSLGLRTIIRFAGASSTTALVCGRLAAAQGTIQFLVQVVEQRFGVDRLVEPTIDPW